MPCPSVILTGGCGFVGRAAVSFLIERGFQVHILTRAPDSAICAGFRASYGDLVRCHRVDLLDLQAIRPVVRAIGATHLLHLAWDTRHGIFWSSPENHQWIASSRILVESFIESGGSRIVAAGTGAEYDWNTSEGVFNESNSPLRPATLYGESKLAFREILFELAKQHGISCAWGRIFFLFGPHEGRERLVSSAILTFLRGEPFAATLGDQLRDFSYVVDVAEAFVALLDSSVTGDLNVASGEARSIASVLISISSLMNCRELLQLGAKPKGKNEPDSVVASVKRLRDEVGVIPAKTFDQRLSETVEWWCDSQKTRSLFHK